MMLPFSGVPSFVRAPLRDPFANDWQADAAVLGVPFDLALGFRPGARFAPMALRVASLRYAVGSEGFYDLQSNTQRFKGRSLADANDVLLPSLEPALARERIETTARALRQRATLPIFVGGDHSVTHPLLCAFDDVPEMHVVQFDAHLDFTDVRNDTRHSNSSPFRRASEDCKNLTHITTVGLRGLRHDPEAVHAARAKGHTLVGAWELQDLNRVMAQLPRGQNVYISFDVDVFDPSFFPATSSPEPDGISFAASLALIQTVAKHNSVVGCDFVEFTPNLDASGNSALFLARLVMETIAAVLP